VQRAAYLSEGEAHGDFRLPPLVETVEEIRTAIEHGTLLKALLGTRIVGAVRGAGGRRYLPRGAAGGGAGSAG